MEESAAESFEMSPEQAGEEGLGKLRERARRLKLEIEMREDDVEVKTAEILVGGVGAIVAGACAGGMAQGEETMLAGVILAGGVALASGGAYAVEKIRTHFKKKELKEMEGQIGS